MGKKCRRSGRETGHAQCAIDRQCHVGLLGQEPGQVARARKTEVIKQDQQQIGRALHRFDLESRRWSGVADVEFLRHLPWRLGQRQYGAIGPDY